MSATVALGCRISCALLIRPVPDSLGPELFVRPSFFLPFCGVSCIYVRARGGGGCALAAVSLSLGRLDDGRTNSVTSDKM